MDVRTVSALIATVCSVMAVLFIPAVLFIAKLHARVENHSLRIDNLEKTSSSVESKLDEFRKEMGNALKEVGQSISNLAVQVSHVTGQITGLGHGNTKDS